MKKAGSGRADHPRVTRGSVLDDLDFTPAEALEIKVKAEIYRDLLKYIGERGCAQQELAAVLGIHQPDVSHLLNGQISKFSVGKLIKFAGRLNLQARVKLSMPKSSRAVAVDASSKPRKRMSALR